MNSNSSTIKKVLINGIVFAIVLGLTIYVVFRHISVGEIITSIKLVRFRYIAGGLCAMAIFAVGEGLNIGRPLRAFGDDVSVFQAIKYAVVGFFFSSVTPSSSGGQPMQLYFMHGDEVPVSHGTLALLFELMSFEIIATVFSVTGYITQRRLLMETMGRGRFVLLIGIVVSILIVAFLCMAIFSRRAISVICAFGVSIVRHFSKEKADVLEVKADLMVQEYRSSAVYFKENKGLLVKSLITTAVQLIAMFSVPYFVYMGFGLDSYSAFQIISLQSILYVAVAFLPLPGAVGVSEGAFIIAFRLMYPKNLLGPAMVLTRCLNLSLIHI